MVCSPNLSPETIKADKQDTKISLNNFQHGNNLYYVRYQQITRKIRAMESTKWQLIAFGDLSFRRPNNVKPRKRDNSIMQNRVRIKYVRDKYNIIKIKTFTVSFMSDSAKKSWICKWMNLKLSTKATFPFHYKCAENNQKMVAPNLVSQKNFWQAVVA